VSERTVRFADPMLQAGFTQIPNAVLLRSELSVAARLTFGVLASFAWKDERCYPGQERVGALLGVGERAVRSYIGELKEAGQLEVERRGLGKSNAYILLPDRNERPGLSGSSVPGKNTKVEEDEELASGRKKRTASTPTSSKDIERVWARYVERMSPRRKEPDAEQRRIIAGALKVASAQECCQAVDGCAASDFHMKRGAYEGRSGARYNTLSHVLRGKRGGRTTREQIDYLIDLAAVAAEPPDDLDPDQVRREQGLS
jgi:hypothetical protein